jgi:3-deoxy-D-manno-octulosonate 8-phosphate phosphatase (KDO 8-P phosphatase)
MAPTTSAPSPELVERLRLVELLALDFDGVLTDGRLYIDGSGQFTKAVHYLDILGVVRWRRSGHRLCIISGDGTTGIADHYAAAFKVTKLYTGRTDKLEALNEAAAGFGMSLDKAIYMGDDIMDLAAITAAGVGATVPTAHPHLLDHADWTSTQPAGAGAVRELIDLTLSAQGHPVTDMRPSGDHTP